MTPNEYIPMASLANNTIQYSPLQRPRRTGQ